MFGTKKVNLEIAAGNRNIQGKKVTISPGKQPGKLLFSVPWKTIEEFKVNGVAWQEGQTRSAGKAALGAAVGGLLTGGIGLLAGAAIGGRKRDASTVILDMEGGPLYLRCSSQEYETLISMIPENTGE